MFKTLTAAALLAGVMSIGAVSSGEAARMRTVVCPNGKTVQVADSQSSSRACMKYKALKIQAAGQQSRAGNPCNGKGSNKGCRDWVLGNKKPPVRDKK